MKPSPSVENLRIAMKGSVRFEQGGVSRHLGNVCRFVYETHARGRTVRMWLEEITQENIELMTPGQEGLLSFVDNTTATNATGTRLYQSHGPVLDFLAHVKIAGGEFHALTDGDDPEWSAIVITAHLTNPRERAWVVRERLKAVE